MILDFIDSLFKRLEDEVSKEPLLLPAVGFAFIVFLVWMDQIGGALLYKLLH